MKEQAKEGRMSSAISDPYGSALDCPGSSSTVKLLEFRFKGNFYLLSAV
jgi:hypothetical protein